MEKNKKIQNIIIIIICAIIVVLLFYIFFSKKTDLVFSLNEKDIKIKIGEKKRISYQVNIPNLKVKWSSNNEIITVNEDGDIIANDYGQATITATVINNEESVADSCIVNVYSGSYGIEVESITIPDGYLLMKTNSEYELPFNINPSNAYITSVKYYTSDSNIIDVNDNKIVSKSEGNATVSMVLNNEITKDLVVRVKSDARSTGIVKDIDKIIFDEENITMEMGDELDLSYETNPKDGYIETIEWFSSNENVVSVSEGVVVANNIGEATITITINNKVSENIDVKVNATKEDIVIDYNPKTTIRIGETTNIKAHINISNINDKIVYKSNNPSIVKVENGVITGISSGTAVITLSVSNGKSKSYTINVLPKSGSFTGKLNLWGYKSLNSKTPVYADKAFFQQLASNGVGLLQGNTYIINTSEGKFSYDISGNLLTASNKKVKVRIYYPPGVDLSTTNTLTFMGGRGETNFDGMFSNVKKDPSIIKSGGIMALIAEGASFDGDSGAYTTMFVKAITKQKAGVKNSILGFSDGAHKVMHASKKMTYDRIVVFSGYTDGVDSLDNAKNSEIFFIIASGDGNYRQAQNALGHMKSSGYKNVTIISMGTDMATKFSDKFLVLNPGSLMENKHVTNNILLSGILEYLND